MDENFRRAIRKMTGKSLVRLGGRPDRAPLVAELSQNMAPTWSIALSAHLEAALDNPEDFMAGSETISLSNEAWRAAQGEFPALAEEFRARFEDFRVKWLQRFSTEEIMKVLMQGRWVAQDPQGGWTFALKGRTEKEREKEARDLYYETAHLLVGDAEKLLVMMVSRALHLQDRLASVWHKESAVDAMSKVLPSLEASLREFEDKCFFEIRETLPTFAFTRFALAFRTARGSTIARAPTVQAVARQVGGAAWNPLGTYENAFLAYLEDFCDYTRGLTLLIGDWYHNKWSLYLRGFSRGQLDLFGAPALASKESL